MMAAAAWRVSRRGRRLARDEGGCLGAGGDSEHGGALRVAVDGEPGAGGEGVRHLLRVCVIARGRLLRARVRVIFGGCSVCERCKQRNVSAKTIVRIYSEYSRKFRSGIEGRLAKQVLTSMAVD